MVFNRTLDKLENDIAFELGDLPIIPAGDISEYQKIYPHSWAHQRLAYGIDQGWITQSGYFGISRRNR
jgi:hypothetical protein